MYVCVCIYMRKKMTTHSSILVWKIPWIEELGGLQSMRSQRVGHDWATNTHTHTQPPHHFHSSFVEHLGWFHVLAIVNNAAVNIGVHLSFPVMIFFRYMPRCQGTFKESSMLHFSSFVCHFSRTFYSLSVPILGMSRAARSSQDWDHEKQYLLGFLSVTRFSDSFQHQRPCMY